MKAHSIIEYKGYGIAEKRDWGTGKGHYIDGFFVRHGYVVTGRVGLCNMMPGATWFLTVVDAKRAIDDLITAGDDAERFWQLVRRRRAAEQKAPELASHIKRLVVWMDNDHPDHETLMECVYDDAVNAERHPPTQAEFMRQWLDEAAALVDSQDMKG